MTLITDLISNDWTNALGWTLLHSIWQSLVILLIVVACLRFIPAMRSGIRYTISCTGLFIFVATIFSTFFYLLDIGEGARRYSAMPVTEDIQLAFSPDHFSGSTGTFSSITSAVESNMTLILAVWAAGFLFFSIRLSTAFLYTYRLRSSAIVVGGEWSTFVVAAGKKLNIDRLISLAESTSISTPVVIGYIKPVILIPVGMLTGLSSEQLETIFLHELAHIKRHDYLVNLLQSITETVFFFNPFIWILSKVIRREREYCCDDLVVRHHGGTRAYAHALARLAEAHLAFPGFALSLANDKNQLLNRIRRIMEKSTKNYSAKSRMVIPVVLLLGALLCISWLGTDGSNVRNSEPQLTDRDTIPGKKPNGARYSRKSIITIDENGQPHEEIVEEFEGDEKLRPLLEEGIPDISVFPALPNFPADPMPPAPVSPFSSDTIPPPYRFQNSEDWEDFAKSFQDITEAFDTTDFMKEFRLGMNLFDLDSFRIPDHALDVLKEFESSDAFKDMKEQFEQLRELDIDHFQDFEKQFDFDNGRIENYQDKLRDQLVEDGYLSNDEPVESLEWNNESFKVNGKSIKESDMDKYQKLNDEFFGKDKVE